MLIDGAYLEETRVVICNEEEIDDFDHETKSRQQVRGNLYLAKVARVEPSLQAAFVDYGKEKHGFLSFSEIHPDYFQIPVADRKLLLQREKDLTEKFSPKDPNNEENNDADVEKNTTEQDAANFEANINFKISKEREKVFSKYRIQEVIKKGQILLIQVVKEERGNKGAAVTTYISLAGRYCVLMANTARKGGISRRITQSNTRKKLRSIVDSLEIPENMAVIIRTAGEKRTKPEIKRDFQYLTRVWEKIRSITMKSVAPVLVHEENNIIKRAIRDLYTPDIENIYVEGELAFKAAKDYMKTLMPSKVKTIKIYKDKTPLLQFYNYEKKLERMFDPIVHMNGGGYIVINQTEALVAIDVNSGRATRERNIEGTALQTNKQAAHEVARQIKLRNLSGLIIIDFIDMLEYKHNRIVENTLKQSLNMDRAKIQVGQISNFGLLEMSRQRIGPSVYEADFQECKECNSSGKTRSLDSLTLKVLRQIQEISDKTSNKDLYFKIKKDIGINILNKKRKEIADIETLRKCIINIIPDESLENNCEFIDTEFNSNLTGKEEKRKDFEFDRAKNKVNEKTKQPIKQNTKSKTINKNIVSRPKRINKSIKVNSAKVNNDVNKNTSQVIPIKFIKQENEEIIENKSKKNTTKETNKAKKNLNKESKVIVAKNKVANKKKKLPAKSGWWNKEAQNN